MRSILSLIFFCSPLLFSQPKVLELTLPYSIELAFRQGYGARSASASYQATMKGLEADLMQLRTSVSFNAQLPNYSESLTNEFNPLTAQYEYYEVQTAQVQGGLTISQPLTFLGGTLTLQEQLIGRGQTSGLSSSSKFRRDFFNNLTFQYRQPLFTPNTYRMTEERNRIASDQARADFVRTQLDIEYAVTESFYSLYQLQQRSAIIREQVNQNQEMFETARTKFSSGLVPEVDYLQSEVDLVSSQNDLLNVERDVSRASNAFRQLLGLSDDQQFTLVAAPAYSPVTVDRNAAITKALGGRSEVIRARQTIDLRLLDISTAEARGGFRADLTASYGINGATSVFNRLLDEYGVTRGGVLSLSIPIFDWGSNELDVQAARIQHRAALMSLENTQQQIRLEILDLLNRLRAAESRILVLEKVVFVAQKGYDISVERFKTGTASRNDLAQSQQRLTNAKLNNLNAMMDYQIALADLRRRTLWDFERNVPIAPRWFPDSGSH